MDLTRPRDLILFGMVAGVVFYLASALWSALFIVALPQDRDWCKDMIELQTGESSSESRCVEFKNTLEQLKYYHNLDMLSRNRYWIYGELIAGAISGWLMFAWLRSRRGMPRHPGTPVGSAMYGVAVALFVPLVLSWLLPPPVRWFPRQIVEYADAKIERELNLLNEVARDLDADKEK